MSEPLIVTVSQEIIGVSTDVETFEIDMGVQGPQGVQGIPGDLTETSNADITGSWKFSTPLARRNELRYYGLPNGTDDTTTVQDWLNYCIANDLKAIATPASQAYRIGNILIDGTTTAVEGLHIQGEGAEFTLIGTAASPNYSGLELRGTLNDVEVEWLVFQGDGVVASRQAGIWAKNNANQFDGVRLAHNRASDIVVGLYMDVAGGSAYIRDFESEHNRIYRAVGTASGEGYGAAVSGVENFTLFREYYEATQRHACYLSAPPLGSTAGTPAPNKGRVIGCISKDHRVGITKDASPKPAFAYARVQNIRSIGNQCITPYDTGFAILQDTTFDVWNVFLDGDEVTNPQVPSGASSGFPAVALGSETTPSGGAHVMDIGARDVKVLIDAQNINCMQIYNGLRVTVRDCRLSILNAAAGNDCITIGAAGFPAESNNYTIEGLRMHVTDGASGATGIRLQSTAATSGLTAVLRDNRIVAPAASRLWASTTITDAINLRFQDHENYTNLTFGAGQAEPRPIQSDVPTSNPNATNNDLLAWTYDPIHAVGNVGTAPTSGQLILSRIRVETTGAANSLLYYVGSAGSGLTSGQNFLGVYDSGGNKLAETGDMSGTWNTTGSKTSTLTTSTGTLQAGSWIYVVMLFNGTTGPLLRDTGSTPASNSGITTSGKQRYGTVGSGHTTLPATFPVGSVATLLETPWFGVKA